MSTMPEQRALLGVDLIDSSEYPGEQRRDLPGILAALLTAGMAGTALVDVMSTEDQHTGDGRLLAFPATHLPAVVLLATRLDELAAQRNARFRPSVRLRLAVELGALPDTLGYYGPAIDRARLLNADLFKAILARCSGLRSDGSPHSGLILSDRVHRAVFGDGWLTGLNSHDFAAVHLEEKASPGRAWIRVPGFDAFSITEFARQAAAPSADRNDEAPGPTNAPSAPEPPSPRPPTTVSGGRNFTNQAAVHGHQISGDHNQFTSTTFNATASGNTAGRDTTVAKFAVRGDNNGVQADNIHGDINFGGR
ncbi:hypothetical protein [Actinoalloteichus hymeniacidonis]|uniref:Uncharacterized protein n=1 Tax=Actinoalloteichus hymeniacidonis TaxID=340345 RepID=A0AAC9HT53_9PSEU|nr:hypothetical protein [Actinoalloteichus hymeniacidonis]AOS64958.1 hypothetical protein TL08_20835 [Actinoalloteichus hymeniacidonis]MBB5906967.1 hypothetical protein [Actinoalloteichus hymeniacidonis]